LSGTNQFLVNAHDFNVLGGSTYYKGSKEAFVITNKETGLEVIAEETTYVWSYLETNV
jgi:hypothetical protein